MCITGNKGSQTPYLLACAYIWVCDSRCQDSNAWHSQLLMSTFSVGCITKKLTHVVYQVPGGQLSKGGVRLIYGHKACKGSPR